MARPPALLAAVLLAAPTLSAQDVSPERPSPAAEGLPAEVVSAQLDRAVRRTARPSLAAPLVLERCRVYRLPGYGVLFVLPPQSLPGSVRTRGAQLPSAPASRPEVVRAMKAMEEGLRHVSSPVVREQMQRTLSELRLSLAADAEKAPADPALPGAGRMVEWSAGQSPDGETAYFSLRIEESSGPLAPAAAGAPPRAVPTVPASASPGGPAAPAASDLRLLAGPAGPPAAASEPSYLPAPPPWLDWFGAEEVDTRPPDRVVGEVREALAEVLLQLGGRLLGVGPQDYVAAAVDFLASSPAFAAPRPARTLMVRVRRADLEARRLGQLSAEELRARTEAFEY